MNRITFAGRQYVKLSALPTNCQGLDHTPHPFQQGYVHLGTALEACLGQGEPTPSHAWAIDFRTLAYPIVAILEKTRPEVLDQANMTITELAQLLWLYRFTHIPAEVSQHWAEPDPSVTRIICDDYPFHDEGHGKAIYWRHKIWPEYKGGRPEKPDRWDLVTQAGYWAAERLGLPVLREPRMEADDHLAWLARHRHDLGFASLTIWTLDTDLLQLVEPEPCPVKWYNVLQYLRLRDHESALSYWLKRHKKTIGSAKDIVDQKVRFGDRSDNIPGQDKTGGLDLRGIIDLWDPLEAPTQDHSWVARSNHAKLSELMKSHQAIQANLLLSGVEVTL